MTEAIVKIQLDKSSPAVHVIDGKNSFFDLQSLRLRVAHEEGESGGVVIETPGNWKDRPKKDMVARGRTLGFRYNLSGRRVFVQVEHK